MIQKLLCWLLFLPLLMPLGAAAQDGGAAPPPAAGEWGLGAGLGNGLELHGGYYGRRWLALGRLRGKWWGPDKGPKPQLFGDDINTRAGQTEAAALLGYPLALGRTVLYGAAGVAYVSGRELGEYRFTLREGGLFSTDATHYYSYRDYRGLGLPLEIGLLTPLTDDEQVQLGLSGQANFGAERAVYCLLGTVTFFPGRAGRPGR